MILDLTPLGLAVTIIASILILLLPRRLAALPLLAAACYMTVGQVVMVGPFDFTVHRILLLSGWTRVVLRGEIDLERLSPLDRIVILWAVVNMVAHTLLVGTTDAFINRLGFLYNALGFYFLFRFLVTDMEDIRRVGEFVAILVVPLAAAMVFESLTRTNLFSRFGGVPPISAVRAGEVRAQGAFRHPILAGTFGATIVPLIISLWWSPFVARRRIVMGVLAGVTVAFVTSSSGPVLTLGAGLGGLMAWGLRYQLRVIRWGVFAGLVGLHFAMRSPVWFLIDRVGDIVGGEGYHRSFLIDQAIAHLDEWWLLGSTYTAHWMPYALPINPDMVDITNYYLRMGLDGGVVTMGLFIVMLALAFRVIGRATRAMEEIDVPPEYRISVWALGATLTAHAVAFISVSYFDQIVVFWYMLLALIGTVDDTLVTLEDDDPEELGQEGWVWEDCRSISEWSGLVGVRE
jgi:hypothetical protein